MCIFCCRVSVPLDHILLLLCYMDYFYAIFSAFRQNCSAQITSQKSDKCVFECIKKIYDKQHCSISTDEEHSPRVTLNSNDILPSLMNYDSINYVIGKHIFAPNNSGKKALNVM